MGARDLRECLAVQLAERNRLDPAMQALLDNLDLLAKRELRRLMVLCGVDADDLAEMIAELRQLDPKPGATLLILTLSITLFWVFPFLLKFTGRYALLSYISVQVLLFAILWGCYFYGGASSPFLPWLVTVPLLAFFYLGEMVEVAPAVQLFTAPREKRTQDYVTGRFG